ncbi:MAG: cation diffusion facilitator family transporter [Euryarchaeota archaeon]|nr:cation diffusion facilitator family transporter [Euryarchaeota archaeon]MDE1835259.1 cation diffusion facilitator family transporter [Euryarchaeota archaeon]MDE2043555.1 cation diffusion facilitator family transporter [Thermoplasmata archaeon]
MVTPEAFHGRARVGADGGARTVRTSNVVIATLLLDGLFFGVNFVVFALGGSRAVLSQAVATVTDLIGSVMILWGQWAGELPSSPKHPFGRGKEAFFWAYSAGLITFSLAGGLVLFEGLDQALHPRAVTNLKLGLWTVGGTLLSSLGSMVVVLAELRRDRRSISELLASSHQGVKTIFLQDVVSVVGALVALVGISVVELSHLAFVDGVSASIVGTLLLGTGFALAAEGREFLVGRALEPEEGHAVLALVERYPFVRQVLGMQSMLVGPEDSLVVLRVNFMDEMDTDDVEMHIDQLRRFVTGEFPRVRHLIIEPVRAAGEELVMDDRQGISSAPGAVAPSVPVTPSPPRPSDPRGSDARARGGARSE